MNVAQASTPTQTAINTTANCSDAKAANDLHAQCNGRKDSDDRGREGFMSGRANCDAFHSTTGGSATPFVPQHVPPKGNDLRPHPRPRVVQIAYLCGRRGRKGFFAAVRSPSRAGDTAIAKRLASPAAMASVAEGDGVVSGSSWANWAGNVAEKCCFASTRGVRVFSRKTGRRPRKFLEIWLFGGYNQRQVANGWKKGVFQRRSGFPAVRRRCGSSYGGFFGG